MYKIFVVTILVLMSFSCKEKSQAIIENEDTEYMLHTDEWPSKFKVNSEVNDILMEWPEYSTVDASFDALYNVDNKDDLALTIENIIEEQKLLEASEYPTEFDKPQIKSRQKVFKTYVLKVKGDLFYRLDPKESVIEMIEAYNTYRKQFNVVINSSLDTKLIFEE